MSRTNKEAILPLKKYFKTSHKLSLSYWNQSWVKDQRIKWPIGLKIKIDGFGYSYWEDNKDNYYLLKESFRKLKDHSNVKSVILDLHCGEIDLNKDFCLLIKQLRNLPRLKKLTLNFQYYKTNENTLKIFQAVLQQLKYLPQLSHLTIKTCMQLTNDDFLAITDGVFLLRNLSSFCCEIKLQQNVIPPSTIERFFLGLSRFDQLSSLSLKLNWYKWPHGPIQLNKSCWTHLSCLNNLRSLHVSIFTQIKMDKENIEAFFQSLKSLKKLRILSLDFASYPEPMSLEMGEALLNGFKFLDLSLSELYVSFPEVAEFTEETVNGFAKCLLLMKESLECLALDFTKVKNLADEEMLEFLKHLSSLGCLKTLNLRFFGKPITDYFLQNLSFRWTFLPNLSSLKLYFQKPDQATNKGLKALSRNLVKTRQLSSFDLFFGLLPNVTNSSFQAFFYGFQEFKNLTNLKLDLSEHEQVTDESMIALATGLGNLHKLQSLDLDLTYCKNLTNQGMCFLSSGFKNLTQLESFALDVLYCPEINEQSLEYWYQGLQELFKLKNTKFSIFYSKDLSNEDRRRIGRNIKGIVWCSSDFEPWMDFNELTGSSYWITNPKQKC